MKVDFDIAFKIQHNLAVFFSALLYKLLLPPLLWSTHTHTQSHNTKIIYFFIIPLIWSSIDSEGKRIPHVFVVFVLFFDVSEKEDVEWCGESWDSWGTLHSLPVLSLFPESAAFYWLCMWLHHAKVERSLCLSSKAFQKKGFMLLINFKYLCVWEELKWCLVAKMHRYSVCSLVVGI